MNTTKQRGYSVIELSIAVLLLLATGGWIANVVKLFGMFDGPVTALFIGRIVGVFAAPLGAVLGYF